MQLFTVTNFIGYVNDTFKAVWDPHAAAIEGEVSGFRISQGQWVSFDLKDEKSLINVFTTTWKLSVPLQDGMRVRIQGMPQLYGKYGKFSLSADQIELVGEGALRKALEALRLRLQAEGLFDPARKRTLPRFPQRIALIASRESAAYGDFVRIVNERWGGLEIDLYHVLVQGENAPAHIMRAIQQAHKQHEEQPYDALIITRGGGSFEELMAFNHEQLVRTIYASKIPTLVGIGHERDLSLAEEVADIRGSTPTDCARRLVPDRREVLFELATMQQNISTTIDEWIQGPMERINQLVSLTDHWMQRVRLSFDLLPARIDQGFQNWKTNLSQRLTHFERLLVSYDPSAVIKRGYTIVRDRQGKVVTSTKQLSLNDPATLELRDGSAEATIHSIRQQLL